MPDPIERLNAALEGRYSIDRELGEGGMATVYLAEDLKHQRKVAIKVLKPELAAIVGGGRFLVEIRTTAALQHPHIVPLFDSGEVDEFLFYVMPYVEGESLRERLDRDSQLPVEEAVGIARNVASALEYAHEQGVIHRDIKPANILLHRGEPLVADFGIALAVAEAGGGRITETGLSVGTPHYMSPEQAAGERSLDPRSDVYALGCVLYEMLAGQPPHAGPTAQAVLARILTDEARPVRELRGIVPPNVDAAVAGSLAKLPADRISSPAELQRALDDPGYRRPGSVDGEREATGARTALRRWKMATMSLGTLALVLAGFLALRPESPRARVFRAALSLDGVSGLLTPQIGPSVALSRDGSTLAYFGRGEMGQWQLWLRRADALDAAPLPGTESSFTPVFSPDGLRLALSGPTFELEIVDLQTGAVRTLTDRAVSVLDWTAEGYIYYFRGESTGNVWRIPEDGGEPEPVAVISGEIGPTPRWGFGDILPGGQGAVMTEFPQGMAATNTASVVAVNFETGDVRHLAQGTFPRYVEDGYVLWGTADGTIMAAEFDAETLDIGVPRQVADGVLMDQAGTVHYSVDEAGGLVYRTGASSSQTARLVWVDRDGSTAPASDMVVLLTVGLWDALGISPDGSRVALSRSEGAASHVWIQPLGGSAPPSRITFEGTLNVRPQWSPDGRSLTYVTNRSGPGVPSQLWMVAADGSGDHEPLVVAQREVEEGFLSPDGEWVVYRLGGTSTVRDIYARPMGADTTVRPLAATDANERAAALSPDGRWLAYVSDETGRDEVFVTRFPEGTGKWQVSSAGGTSPAWGQGDSELFYVAFNGRLTAAKYATSGRSFAVSGLEQLFSTGPFVIGLNATSFVASPEDGRLLMIAVGDGAGGEVVWVRNWVEAIREPATGGR